MRIIFRVDAGPHVGLGHLQRCLSLAMAVRERGVVCVFLVSPADMAQAKVASCGFEVHALTDVNGDGRRDLEETLAAAERHACDIIVVDSYSVDDTYLKTLRSSGFCVVAIDDLGRHPFSCQWVINGGVHAHQLNLYSSSGDTTFLLGPQYALLRPEFWSIPSRSASGAVRKILFTLGGSDFSGLMPSLLRCLDKIPGDFTVTAIVGPFFLNVEEIKRVASVCQRRIHLVESPASLLPFMLEADLAVSAGGQTLYELAAAGVPTVAIEVAENQGLQMKVFEAEGFLHSAGIGQSVESGLAAAYMVDSLQHDQELRWRMSRAGQRLVDGKGSLRVAEAIVNR